MKMKIKSTSANKFRYVSFTEQVEKVSVDITRWHSSLASTSVDNETYFNDAIVKYWDLDHGAYFENFLNEIPYSNGELRTYAQLLYQKDIVAKALIKHLNIKESTSLTTLLQLTTAFAQDLREDLQNYLWDFVEAVISILERSHENTEVLETGFFTLAKIFWLQRKHLVLELREVFRRFKRLFSCKRAYMRRFITEAIAFLFRKSKAIDKLTVFLAETAFREANSSLIDSISRLYFNALKATRGQFHSTAPQVLTAILQMTFKIERDDVRNVAIQILEGTMHYCSAYTSKQYSEPLLNIILEQYKLLAASSNIASTSALAKFLTAWISEKKGRTLHKPSSLFETVTVGIKNASRLEKETIGLLRSAITLFHSNNDVLTLIISAIRTVIDSAQRDDVDLVLDFLVDLTDISLFDLWIMPIVGTYMSKLVAEKDIELDGKIFKFYASLCSTRRPIWAKNGEHHLFFDASNHLQVRSRLIEVLKLANEYEAEMVGCCLMTYPWLWRSSEKPEGLEAVFNIFESSVIGSGKADARLALLAANACALFDSSLFNRFTVDDLLKYCKNMGNNEGTLRILDLALPFVKDSNELNNVSMMCKVANEILPMFGHWSSNVRQIALEILYHFNVPLNNVENDDGTIVEAENAFAVLLRAERTPWTLEDYRTRLLILRQLSYGVFTKHMPRGCDSTIETVPLRVIIGNLYEPFTIAWRELKVMIQEYAYGLNIDLFFTLLFSFIHQATEKIVSGADDKLNECNILDKITDTMGGKRSPDYEAFRLELLGILGGISELAERRTKLLSPLFINFFRNEYQRGNLLEKRENILLAPNGQSSMKYVVIDGDDDEGESDISTTNYGSKQLNTEKAESEIKKGEVLNNCGATGHSIKRRLMKRTLIAFLELFGKFNAPKSFYMAKEIRDLYNELLVIGDQSVQKHVLKCIFAYKYKYLTPYKEFLDGIVEERIIVNSLTKFGVDTQNSLIDVDHRADLMPIVLRVLYGKCSIYHRGIGDRRAAIFRFIAGCNSNEIDFFLNLLFAPLLYVIGNDDELMETLCERLMSNFDPSSVIPLHVIKGSFRSISLIVTRLSPALTNVQKRFLFRLCLASALLSRLAVQDLDLVQPHYVRRLKELRRLACTSFKEIFQAFQDRKFEADELNAFLKYFVGPLCRLGSDDSLPSIPLSIVRLFLSWTFVPKLFYLLRLQIPLDVSKTLPALSILCSILSSNSVNELNKSKIIDGVLNLLTLADEKSLEPMADINLVDIPNIPNLNTGTAMVIGELPKLMAFIFGSLPKKDENRKLNMKHLEVLSRISEFVNDEKMSERFVKVLLTYLESGTIRPDSAIESLLLTVSHMIVVTGNPEPFLKNLISLQSSLTERTVREALQKVEKAVILKLKARDERKAELLSLVASLDAWDGRTVGEPDYDERHSAYVKLHEALEAKEPIELVILFLALHNDYHIMTQMKDISLRSAATRNFHGIIEYLERCDINTCEKHNAIDSHLLPLILKGLHDKKEMVRHDFVNLLVAMITNFPQHKHLRHLVSLRNTAEVDLDFFENVVHLQIHRRQRAFSRLMQSLKSKEICIPNEVLLRFLLPLLQPYVTEMSSNTSSLSDAALGLLKEIMRGAPWKKYFPMLDFYLKRLRKENVNHKAIVRVIVAIVDAFHFSISDNNEVSVFEPASKRRNLIVDLQLDKSVTNDDNTVEVEDITKEKIFVEVTGENDRNCISSVHEKVVNYLIPRLKDCATSKDLTSHRKAQSGKYYKEDDDIQRAPIALATVKLLQKMPQAIMDQNLHGVLIKICSLLMSRSISVREAAGKTVIEIAQTLGPKYLRFIIREMKQSMKKGYQVHVMIFYVHKLLSAMEEQLCSGDLDSCMMDIVEVCNMDLFGEIADEKTVMGITKNVPEAKIQRAYETYRLIGRYISSSCLGNIVTVLKKAVESAPDAKTVKKVGRLLRHYSLGVSTNKGVEPSVVLIFSYQVLKEHMMEGMMESEDNGARIGREMKEGRRPDSCLLLEKEPSRVGMIVKVSTKSKLHIFVEFGLFEFYLVLKKKTFDAESSDDVARLDPFVDIILQCLQLKYDQILVNSLRCFLLLLKFPLPSLRSNMPQFMNRLFVLLADYTALGATLQNSLEVSQLVFKVFTQIIKDAPNLVITSKRLELLLTYVETDIIDTQKQAVAFPLIKAIIIRKLQDPKIVEIIRYLSEMAIISEASHIREQCRQVLTLYVANRHPQCKKPMRHVEFFLEQLEYKYEDGRKSAIEMLNVFFEKFKENVNDQYALLAFVKLAARLINDESSECRQMIALTIQQLMNSVSDSKRNDMYLATRDWLESKKEVHRCIAMQVMVIFDKLKPNKSANTIRELLPLLSGFIRTDILYSYAEQSIGIIVDNLTLLLSGHEDQMTYFAKDGLLDSILREIGSLVQCRESTVVQLAASRFLSLVFSSLDSEYLSSRHDPSPRNFMQWTLAQFKTFHLSNELAEQAAKNVIYLFGAVVRSDNDLQWLCHRLKLLCQFEIAKLPAEALRRINVFKIAAAVFLKIKAQCHGIVVEALLPSLYREVQGKSPQNSEMLQQIAKEVMETMKRKMGDEEFMKRLAECQKLLASRFEERKRKRKEEVILDPVSAARKKLRKNEAKRGAKKCKKVRRV